jgi:hypothetical protein
MCRVCSDKERIRREAAKGSESSRREARESKGCKAGTGQTRALKLHGSQDWLPPGDGTNRVTAARSIDMPLLTMTRFDAAR